MKKANPLMDIIPPADDKGIRRLKQGNEKGELKQADSVAPYPRIEPSEEMRAPRLSGRPERRRRQRRFSERRHYNTATVFDTRGGEERRKSERRRTVQTPKPETNSEVSSDIHRHSRHIDEET